MKNKKVGCISLIVIVISIVVIVASLGGKKDSPDPNLITEYDTNGGVHCVVYKGCDLKYLSAVCSAIEAKVPNSDTSRIDNRDCICSEYVDGMMRVNFSNVIVGDYKFGGECYLEFTDEDMKNYEVHYLQIANEEYINDGIDLESKYGESQEYLDSLEELE